MTLLDRLANSALICLLTDGCRHSRRSFPQTWKGRTHVTCLKCGARANYDMETMQIVQKPVPTFTREDRVWLREMKVGVAR